MTNLQWDTYRRRAEAFMLDYLHVRDEKGEAHSFWDRFFEIFGLQRIRYANHEARVKRDGNRQGFIDLLWKGKLLVEHKSASKDRPEDFDDALRQAEEYVAGLSREDRPRTLVVCNFKRYRVYDLAACVAHLEGVPHVGVGYVEVLLSDLARQIEVFAFMPEYAELAREQEEKANLEAVLRISNVYKTLHSAGYRGHDLELLLVRILFCVFAEDTGIFEPKQFSNFIENHTLDNGSDIGESLEQIFEVLNTPFRLRQHDAADPIRQFPYVNGGLFAEKLTRTPPSLSGIRNAVLGCGDLFDWAQISPEIFGSLFQAALEEAERRSLGAHYTSERNILRLLEPLFLHDLREEFRLARRDRKKLEAFRQKISRLRFLDPACGCGNFLVVTYRELRLLDLETARLLQGDQQVLDISMLENVRLENFCGMEIKPVSALIAQVALWLTKHQCNRLLNTAFHTHLKSVPIDEAAKVVTGNALTLDWGSEHERVAHLRGVPHVTRPFDFIIGNPPFSGSKIMSDEQREEIKTLFGNESGSGTLDYVTGWYLKAARYMDAHPNTRTAFVSTNSIAQGEQVGMLWGTLLEKHGVKIHFAHQTFKWLNEAPGVAAVYCIIVGFGKQKLARKLLFEYADIKGEPTVTEVKNINPYLVEAGDVVVRSRQKPLCDVPEIGIGNKPIDGGHYLFTTEERDDFLKKEPRAARFFRRWIGSDEFINGWERWCLWLGETPLEELQQISLVWERVEAVRRARLESKSAPTQKLAEKPTRFHVENIPTTPYLVIPEVSSERRPYIPIGYEQPATLASNLVKIIANATLFHFGVLHSEMHMAWVRSVCGRLKSDYRYSKDIVYNNFPFPTAATPEQQSAVESAAQAVLEVRAVYLNGDRVAHLKGVPLVGTASLATLYDPEKMPADLLAAHQVLDRAVDACYGIDTGRSQAPAFDTEAKRVAWLFGVYEGLVGKQL
ncbi:MAG: DNA methyltransferase [Saprospiraceae bacterium]